MSYIFVSCEKIASKILWNPRNVLWCQIKKKWWDTGIIYEHFQFHLKEREVKFKKERVRVGLDLFEAAQSSKNLNKKHLNYPVWANTAL